MSEKIEIGDWVRFRSNSHEVVIDIVLYLLEAPYYPRQKLAVCQHATVAVNDILEVRKALGLDPKEG